MCGDEDIIVVECTSKYDYTMMGEVLEDFHLEVFRITPTIFGDPEARH